MNTKIKTIADMTEFLQGKVERRDSLLARFDAARREDTPNYMGGGTLTNFMRSNAILLSVVTFHANEASRFLAFAAMSKRPNGTEYPEADKFADICAEVTDFVVNRARSLFSDVGRSTCASTNLARDATREFYMEFYTRLNHGH